MKMPFMMQNGVCRIQELEHSLVCDPPLCEPAVAGYAGAHRRMVLPALRRARVA
jgi:hypothetical protein